MRVIEEINHPKVKITIFMWNGKYLIKFEAGGFLEQTYKINETDITGVDDIKLLLNDDFIDKVVARFHTMATDLSEEMTNL
jgi:hypothetical protein